MVRSTLMPPLFRYVGTPEALDNSISGKLWLRPFSYFAGIEDPNRRDDREGIASGRVQDGSNLSWIVEKTMVHPHYLLSFTECASAPKDWGKYRLLLSDAEEFKDVIKAHMRCCLVFFDKVIYSDDIDYHSDPTGREMWDRACITKPTIYSSEKEWRLILILNGLSIINNPLKIDVEVLSGVLDFSPGPGNQGPAA